MGSAPGARRLLIEGLLRQSEDLEDRLADWQADSPPTRGEIRDARDEYMAWYHRALPLVPEGERAAFIDRYEGGTFISRVRAFLTEPLASSPLHDPDAPNPLVSPWAHPFADRFRENVEAQRDILRGAIHGGSRTSVVLGELASVFRRLPRYLNVLEQAASPAVPAPKIRNEADLQVVVHALLRLVYDDVRPEDPSPQRAGASSRTDFFLREAEVIIETKMTRERLTDRKVGEELAVDFERYKSHSGCRGVLALVYDPDHRLKNAAGLEHDLTSAVTDPATLVIVVH